jgi:hypothetical protein
MLPKLYEAFPKGYVPLSYEKGIIPYMEVLESLRRIPSTSGVTTSEVEE